LEEALKAALAKKPAGLILDLRGNPGGLLDAAVNIGSYFVPEGNIVIERFQDGHEEVHSRKGTYLLGDTKMAVLVDGGSASASEIVAGAIQDAGTGKLIGEKSYGKGSVQLPNALSDGSQLRVTIAHWFTPKDRGIDGVGLTPDIVVPLTDDDRQAKRDPQLDRAVEFLTTGK
jgi:carboxyl-terminal processing protease